MTMNRMLRPWARGLHLCSIMLLMVSLIGAFPAAAHAAGATVSTFYPATRAAYDAWNASTSTARPPKTTAFPSGTTMVTFYFEFAGTKANTTAFTIVVHNHGGATVATHGPFTLSLGAGLHMSKVPASSGGAYQDGDYHADLLVDGRVLAGTNFRVGSSSATTIRTFYTATKAAYDAWNTSGTAAPPQTSTFPTGTTTVAFYFHYRGARANVTQFKIVIHDHSGATFLYSSLYTLGYVNGFEMLELSPPAHGTYPDGAYHADLIVDGQTVAGADFAVRNMTAAVVSIFYPATKAAYVAWNNTTSTARPPRTDTFHSGTTVLAFYFEYRGARANSTQFKIIVRDHAGSVVATHGPYTLNLGAGLHMSLVDAPSSGAYTPGAYHVDLLVDGRLAAGTTFTVAGQSVSIATFYAATKAAYDAWNATTSTARPPQTSTFRAGTAVITFYFEYDGAAAHTTQYAIVIHDHSGRTVVTHGPYVFVHNAGLHMSPVNAPGAIYPSGAYRADLLIDGHVTASTFFTVGAAPAPPACNASDVVATCVEPSVLRLHANLPNNMEAEGTGFVIQSDATGTYLLTNKHVVEGAHASTMQAISPDGHTTYPVLAIQTTSAEDGSGGDLAVVKLPPTSLRPLTWGDSDHLHLLQQVVSIGYGDAFNLPGPPTVTEGIISALHRDLGDGYGPLWIQHQSFINHGNSGGPLLDLHFNVVGVNTLSMKQTQGIFFAIPANTARQAAQRLIGQMHP